MKKKKELFILVIVLIVLIIICRGLLVFKSSTYTLNVENSKLKIKEEYNEDNYYIEIKNNENTYLFRLFEKLNNRKVVKDVFLYSDENIECILPVILNNVYTDIQCTKNDVIYDYNSIIGENKKLDDYVNGIEIYNTDTFKKNTNSFKTIGTSKIYLYNNLNKNIALTTYKGLLINSKQINLFKNDIYNNKISAFIGDYYIVADYDNDYTFNYFYVVNLKNSEIGKLKTKNDISYDSYIQGIVDNKLYLYDKDNEIQYKINIEDNSINIVSDNNYVKYYSKGKWSKLNKVKANKEIYFVYKKSNNDFTNYDYVKETEYYYYLFKKDGIRYKLYRVDKENLDIYKFIAEVPVTNITFNNNYLYFVYKNKLYYYSDSTGLKILIENSELEFNDTIKYYVY